MPHLSAYSPPPATIAPEPPSTSKKPKCWCTSLELAIPAQLRLLEAKYHAFPLKPRSWGACSWQGCWLP